MQGEQWSTQRDRVWHRIGAPWLGPAPRWHGGWRRDEGLGRRDELRSRTALLDSLDTPSRSAHAQHQ